MTYIKIPDNHLFFNVKVFVPLFINPEATNKNPRIMNTACFGNPNASGIGKNITEVKSIVV